MSNAADPLVAAFLFGLFLLLAALLFTVASLVVGTAVVRPVDVAWLAGGLPDGRVFDIYVAYLRRHRWARLLGCAGGLVVAIVAGTSWHHSMWFSIGIGNGPIGGDLLVGALAGTTLGTLASETYRLRRPSDGRRAASLDARPPRPHLRLAWTARALILASVGAGMVGVITNKTAAIAGAILAVALGVLAELTQRAITDRWRPTSALAAHADGRLRDFAGTSVSWLELAAGTLGLGWSLAAFTPANGPLALVLGLIVLGCLVATIFALVRSGVRPPRRWAPGEVA